MTYSVSPLIGVANVVMAATPVLAVVALLTSLIR
jgi:hypothetical protein